MKRPVLALLVVVAVLAAGTYAVLHFAGSDPAPAAAGPAEPEPAQDSAAPAAVELAGPAPAAPADAPQASADRRDSAAAPEGGASFVVDADARWVEGRVELPPACASDDEVWVVALSRELSYRYFIDVAEDLEREGETSRRPFVARRRVEPDGRFRVPFPADAEEGWLAFRGRFAYLPRVHAVALPATSPLTLTLECGAYVSGRLQPAAGVEDPTSEEGCELELGVRVRDITGGFDPNVGERYHEAETRVRADGTFEFRAVPANRKYTLSAPFEHHAAHREAVDGLAAGRSLELVVPLRRGGVLRGRVHDAEGRPVEGAEVVAQVPGDFFGFDDRAVRERTTDAAGAFELPGVSVGSVVLRASHEGYIESERQRIELHDGEVREGFELLLDRGSRVSGRVTWPDGAPAVGAEVEVDFDPSELYGMNAFNALRGAEGESVADAEGRFEVTGLGRGPFVLEARARPEEPDGSPQERAAGEGEPADEETADEEPAEGTARPRPPLWRARLDGVQPDSEGLEVVLSRPEGVRGRVLDPEGEAVVAFTVAARRQGQGLLAELSGEAREDSFEDDEGLFFLTGLEPGTWEVGAHAEGYGRAERVEVVVPAPEGEEAVVLTLPFAARVSGQVVDSTGAPVPDAEVNVDEGGSGVLASFNASETASARTDPEGRFELEGVTPGKVSLVASADGWADSEPLPLRLLPRQHEEEALLRLRTGGTVRGRVFRPDGEPAENWFVQAALVSTYEQNMTFTDAEGAFELTHLEPGSYQLVAMLARGEMMESKGGDDQDSMASMLKNMRTTGVEVVDGEEVFVTLGAPSEDPVRVLGRVERAGAPYPDALVSFFPEGEGAMTRMRTTQLDSQGRFELELPGPGGYVVAVQRVTGSAGQQRMVEFNRTIPDEDEVEVHLEIPGGRISGRVLGPDGEPAGGARVTLLPRTGVHSGTMWGGQYNELQTEKDGTFDVDGLRAGEYAVMAGGMTMGGLLGDDARYGREVLEVDLDEDQWLQGVTFELEAPGTVRVTVLDAAGEPAPSAVVFARDEEGRVIDRFSMLATDGSGRLSYGGLAPGTYTFSARRNAEACDESNPVRVEAGETRELELFLGGGTLLLVSLEDADGNGVRANVSVKDESGREVAGLIGLAEVMQVFSKGGFDLDEQRIGPLAPGTYRVHAWTDDGRSATKPVHLKGQEERKLRLRLRRD